MELAREMQWNPGAPTPASITLGRVDTHTEAAWIRIPHRICNLLSMLHFQS